MLNVNVSTKLLVAHGWCCCVTNANPCCENRFSKSGVDKCHRLRPSLIHTFAKGDMVLTRIIVAILLGLSCLGGG